ncbi:quinone-dependent dihydroorotate dehydrogenase [Propionibacterium australiense]|uniref:Dihydroorotate dehydrogenase (quinone) n=1 Tax=Propionibacterium australiense TaxID=119981 RepID=A0A383S307_9ACTN|nr:quinone-dependent dihydroorotate dehydrogenase [Propionibacterium australiense]RLP11524.1 quinone-dependent dihydroorotate dehydrogenase [Propionibacterium australiense]RLP12742.1 quinone-dependent dihydroorotate dehydrogenase [Propionibacterium australiense]SYZ32233.1 dihydroorotate dehydrogenase (quinone) [Propionibacterium australiense]VEH90619.1 Dihydroorotate dehydrogenase (quinone) [Propionibacterium australiense]
MPSADELYVRVIRHGYKSVIRPVLFRMHGGDPEKIHGQLISTMGHLPESLLGVIERLVGTGRDPVDLAGVHFPGRVGVAAGLDKDGVAAGVWGPLGFGFAELGTVTRHAQPGNPRPRLFRLARSEAIINRMGFNNNGAEALAAKLDNAGVRRGNNRLGAPIGVSIGKTKKTPLGQAVPDYLFSLETLAPYADYIAINVSSPNTPGLRSLQSQREIEELTGAIVTRAGELDPAAPVPVFVKIAPDLSAGQIDDLLTACESAGISGIIATNTTVGRDGLAPADQHLASQAGGLSGRPLTRMALDCVRRVTRHTELPVMGAGGIMTPADAQAMFDAGARLVQIYTGFIFEGPALVMGINRLCRPDRGAVR